MLIAEQIAKYLTSQSVGTFNKTGSSGNIYVDWLPEKDNIIAIYNREGRPNTLGLGYKNPAIQIIYRGTKNPITSMEKANQIFDTLNGFSGILTTGGNHVVSIISSQGGAASIGKNKEGHHEYSMNFIVDYKKEV